MPAENSRLPRCGIFLVVAGLHVLLLVALLAARFRQAPPADDTVPAELYFFEPEVKPPLRARTARPRAAAQSAAPSLPAPEGTPPAAPANSPPAAPAGQPPSPVDWLATGRAVAGTIAKENGNAGAPADDAASGTATSIWPAPLHHAGEQYQLSTGETIVWVSDRCYLISDPPDPGLPSAFAHLAPSRTACRRDSDTPRGDLFRQTSAYRKLHPDD